MQVRQKYVDSSSPSAENHLVSYVWTTPCTHHCGHDPTTMCKEMIVNNQMKGRNTVLKTILETTYGKGKKLSKRHLRSYPSSITCPIYAPELSRSLLGRAHNSLYRTLTGYHTMAIMYITRSTSSAYRNDGKATCYSWFLASDDD